MTEQELNNRITEILKASEKDVWLCQTSGGRQTGRQYRRIQRVRHDDRLLFLIQHSGYAPNIPSLGGGFLRLGTEDDLLVQSNAKLLQMDGSLERRLKSAEAALEPYQQYL